MKYFLSLSLPMIPLIQIKLYGIESALKSILHAVFQYVSDAGPLYEIL